MDISKSAYKFAIIIYAVSFLFLWYFFYSLGLFIAKNYLPETVSGFSINNPNFSNINQTVSIILGIIFSSVLFIYKKARSYILESADELSDVAWDSLPEAGKSTVLVILLSFVISLFLFCADLIFFRLVNFLLKL